MNLNLLPNDIVINLNEIQDEYVKDRMRMLLLSKSIEEIQLFIGRVYEEGFGDGFKEGRSESE